MTWRSGKRCEDNNGEEEEEMTFPAASSRRLERTPGVRDAIECRRGKAASLGRRNKECGESQERCLGECGEFCRFLWRETDSFVRMLKRLSVCLGDLEGCRKLLLVAGVKHEDLFD